MPKITLPDKSKRDFEDPLTIEELAADIGPGLAKSAVAGKISGERVDASEVITKDCEVEILTADTEEGLEIIRHSCAHLLAHAIKQLYPEVKLAIGPTIDNGFYYVVFSEKAISSDDLLAIEKEMRRVIQNKSVINKTLHSRKEVSKFFKEKNEGYKLKIINESEQDNDFQIYTNEDTQYIK
jgi:threonyl-tRNA synthetase